MGRTILLVLLAVVFVARGQAQVAVYITSSSGHFSNVPTGSVLTGGTYQEQYANFWASGVGGGFTLNFLSLGPVKLGFDFRGSTRPGITGADAAMGGLRLGLNLPLIHLKPYVEGAGGYVSTRTLNTSTASSDSSQIIGETFTNKYAAWEICGGVDYPLLKFVDLRLIEVGGGTGVDIPGPSGSSNLSLFTVNSGLVVHF